MQKSREGMNRAAAALICADEEARGPHITDDQLRALATECVPESTAEDMDRHLEKCSYCRNRYCSLVSRGENEGEAGRGSPPSAEILPGPAILSLVGNPYSLKELSLRYGLPLQVIEGAMSAVSAQLGPVLAEAEEAAQRATEGQYEAWKCWKSTSENQFLEQDEGAGRVLAGAQTPEPLTIMPTAGRYKGNPDYAIQFAETDDGRGEPVCVVSVPPRLSGERWGFCLTFDLEDEIRCLGSRWLSPRALGALRVLHGEKAWEQLLQVLLPLRYAAAGHPIFGHIISTGRARSPLPGRPSRVRFWVR